MYTVYICLYPKYPSFKGGRFSKASFFDIHIKLWGCTSHSDWKRLISYQLIWSSWCHMTISIPWFTHPKTNIAPQNGGLEDDFPFQLGDFEVPCQTSGVYVVFKTITGTDGCPSQGGWQYPFLWDMNLFCGHCIHLKRLQDVSKHQYHQSLFTNLGKCITPGVWWRCGIITSFYPKWWWKVREIPGYFRQI